MKICDRLLPGVAGQQQWLQLPSHVHSMLGSWAKLCIWYEPILSEIPTAIFPHFSCCHTDQPSPSSSGGFSSFPDLRMVGTWPFLSLQTRTPMGCSYSTPSLPYPSFIPMILISISLQPSPDTHLTLQDRCPSRNIPKPTTPAGQLLGPDSPALTTSLSTFSCHVIPAWKTAAPSISLCMSN